MVGDWTLLATVLCLLPAEFVTYIDTWIALTAMDTLPKDTEGMTLLGG